MRVAIAGCLGVVAALTCTAQPYFNAEFIFAPQEKHVHSSSIVECPNGDLLAVWFYGSGERRSNDVVVQGARKKAGSDTWGEVWVAADTPDLPDCNPVLFIDDSNTLWLLWVVVHTNRWERSILKYRVSDDFQGEGAPEWSWQDIILVKPGEDFADDFKRGFEELRVPDGMWAEYAHPYTRLLIEAAEDPVKRDIGWMTRTHPMTLRSGRIIIPLYSDGFNAGLMAISDDQGATWRASKPIVGLGPIQPSVVQKKDGTLIAYMRDSGQLPMRVLKATSTDEGETWSVAVDTEIPNPGSSLEAIALADGRWVMVFNDTQDRRNRLAIAISEDEGATWPRKRYLEQSENGSYAYPSVMQSKSGRIHVTYSFHEGKNKTIKHAELDADWISGSPE